MLLVTLKGDSFSVYYVMRKNSENKENFGGLHFTGESGWTKKGETRIMR
jgi:hypothetical protein